MNDFSGWGTLAKVLLVEDGRDIYVQSRTGETGVVSVRQRVDLGPGEVILIFPDGSIERVASELWHEETWVAVVRIKGADATVVEFGGVARKIPTNGVDYHVGCTVEADADGVISVLSSQPLTFFDLPEIRDDDIVNEFLVADPVTQTFEDFGGLPEVVERARKLIEVPLKHRSALTRIGARPVKGVLFTGEPGTGKTMLARIIAHESKAAFYQIKGPEIVSKWLGQGEEVLRALFKHAERKSNAIIFFDEIDSIAGHRNDDVHEASRRLVAQLLTLMDGYTPTKNVIVIAATNRPQDVDVALRRPGRFDWEIHFPLPGREDRLLILQASSRKLRVVSSLPHDLVAEATGSWSAADLTSIWTEAALVAAAHNREAILPEDYLAGFEAVKTQRAEKERTLGL